MNISSSRRRRAEPIDIDFRGPSLQDVNESKHDLCCLDLNLKREDPDSGKVMNFACIKCERLREIIVKDPSQYGEIEAWRKFKQDRPPIVEQQKSKRYICEKTWDYDLYIGSTNKVVSSAKLLRHHTVHSILASRDSGYHFAEFASLTPSSVTPSPELKGNESNKPSPSAEGQAHNINQHGADMDPDLPESPQPQCSGFHVQVTKDDKALCKVLEVSLAMHLKTGGPSVVPAGGSFPVASHFGINAKEFEITVQSNNTYAICSHQCRTPRGMDEGQKPPPVQTKPCATCVKLRRKLRNMKRNSGCSTSSTSTKRRLQLNPSQVATMSPIKVATAVQHERQQKKQKTNNAARREKRLNLKVANLGDRVAVLEARIVEMTSCDVSHAEACDLVQVHQDDVSNIADIMRHALPLAREQFGADTIQYHTFHMYLKVLNGEVLDDNGNRLNGIKYSESALNWSISALRDSKDPFYDTVRDILFLPDRRHVQRLTQERFGEDLSDGSQAKMIDKKANEAHEWAAKSKAKGIVVEGYNRVAVKFDSMHMRKSQLISSSKKSLGRLIGVVLPEDLSAARKAFDCHVTNLANSVAGNGGESKLEDVRIALDENTEHSVYYVESFHPNCNITFLAAAYNTSGLKASDVMKHIDELTLALASRGLYVGATVSDCGGPNTGFAKRYCTLKAKDFIPGELLSQYQLDGDFAVAYNNPVTGEPIFVIDDPPHVLKRVGGSMDNKPSLQWGDGRPMCMDLMARAFRTVCPKDTPKCFQMRKWRKLTWNHFGKRSSRDNMKVNRIAQILSNTSVGLIDMVCLDDELPNGPLGLPSDFDVGQRTHFYSKLRELLARFNRWFDICNSKMSNGKKHWVVKVNRNNARAIQEELLDMLSWIHEWKASVTGPGPENKVDYDKFLTRETFESMNYVCLSFVAIIEIHVITNGGVVQLKTFNQDVCEQHFSHVRCSSGCHDHPGQKGSMHAVVTSGLKRSIKSSDRGNVTTAIGKRKRRTK